MSGDAATRARPTNWPARCWSARSATTGTALLFRIRDPKLHVSVPVRYTGIVPDPFAAGRAVMVAVKPDGSTAVGQQNSLTTKCPSKYQAAAAS